MKIYNGAVYNCTASDLDARYQRTKTVRSTCGMTCSTCMYCLSLANTDNYADAVASWCQQSRKEK